MGQCAVHRGQLMRTQGALRAAVEEFQHAAKRYQDAGTPDPAGLAHSERGDALRILGDLTAAEDAFATASTHGHEPHPGLAQVWSARGRHDQAVAAVRRVLEETTDPLRRSAVLPATIEVLAAAGRSEEATPAAAELTGLAERFGCSALRARAAHARALLALVGVDHAHALREARAAQRLWGEVDAPYDLARAQVLAGRALQALGEHDTATASLSEAARTFGEVGAVPEREDTLALLGGTPRPAGLTPREVEVLRLVAAGHSNSEIARALVLSEKTVARHLSNIFTKLEVGSRTAAAAFAFENGLA